MQIDARGWYDDNAADVVPIYEALAPGSLHAWLDGLLPPPGSLAVDVGAGSGRDAAWLCGLGLDVVAVEPSSSMRASAARLRPGSAVRWEDDALPGLPSLGALRGRAGFVLASAVWQHVRPGSRREAMGSLAGLLAPGGILALTLRDGPAEPGRMMHPVSSGEVLRLGAAAGLEAVRSSLQADARGRGGVRWTNVALVRPDA